jgi:hydrogenase maturation protease
MNTPPAILVAAVGNASAGADAFGSLVLQVLTARTHPDVELLDLATNPTALLDHLSGRRLLIIVDAALDETAAAPALLDMDYFSPHRPGLLSQPGTSTHALSVANQLELASTLKILPPEVRLIAAVAPRHRVHDIQAVQCLIPQAVEIILQYTPA